MEIRGARLGVCVARFLQNEEIMPIICGTDFSERARAAQEVAAALVSRLGAGELWLAHVLDASAGSLGSAAAEALKVAAERRLRSESELLSQRAGVRVQHIVLAGPASDALLEFAKDQQASLVVVGSEGHSASFILRVGGTSERLARSSPIPVLVVRDGSPFDVWTKGERPLRVLLAVDWSRSSDAAIRWVAGLRQSAEVDVVAGYVYRGEGATRYGLGFRHPIVEPDPEAEALLVRDLEARVGKLGGRGLTAFRAQLGIGRIGDHVLELAESERADLIVVGSHHRRGLARLGSVSGVTLHHSRASVAVVPVPEGELLASDEVPSIRRVLVATDLSPLSKLAIPFGYALLGERGGEVFLLHVRSHDEGCARDAAIAAELRESVPKRGVRANVATRTEIVGHEHPSVAICQAAERLGVDAVCLASRGHSGVKRAVLGSVAEAVMRDSPRPVFIIRPLPP